MDTLRRFFFRAWRPAILIVVLAAAAYFLFFYRLGSLLPGYSSRELQSLAGASHFKDILAHPLDAPYKLFVYLGVFLGHHLLVTRVVAAAYGVLTGVLFFAIVRAWFTYRVALLATILFVTSSGLMHVARLGSPLILQLAPLLIMAAGLILRRSRQNILIFYLFAIITASLVYVPGMVWFELGGLLLWRKDIRLRLGHIARRWHKLLALLLMLAVLAPLIRACIIFPSQIRAVFGLPEHFASLPSILTNFWHMLLAIGIRSDSAPDLWLGHAPLLGIIQIILLIGGVYSFLRHLKLLRTLFLIGGLVGGLILASLNGPVTIAVILPFLYLLIAGGLYELLHEWLAVFPRNPIARFTGIGIVCIVVFFSVLYQWRAYFVAWPHNSITRATFSHRQPD